MIWFEKWVYQAETSNPKDETFSLTDQLRRSASSIAANIAEGSGSESKKDFSRSLSIAIKSAYESVSHLEIAESQGYISEDERESLYREVEILTKRIRSFRSWLIKNS